MKLTLAEVVDKEAVRTNLHPNQLGEDAPRSLCVLLDGERRSLLVPFPDESLLRRKPTLSDMFNDVPQKDRYDVLVELVSQQNALDGSQIEFDYGFNSDDQRYKGLGVLPKKDRKIVEERIRDLREFYLAKQYLARKLKKADLVGFSWKLNVGAPPTEEDQVHYSFSRRDDHRDGPYIASLEGNTLRVNDPKYIRLFRDICKALNEYFEIAKINVVMNKTD